MSLAKPGVIAEFPHRFGWRGAVDHLRSHRTHATLLSGSVVMLAGSAVVTGFNFGYNVAVARLLGPAGFGHASAAVTLLMLISAITLAFQLVCAKFVARNETAEGKRQVYVSLRKKSWTVGILLAAAIAAASSPIAQYLHLPSSKIVLLLASGIAFYIPLGVTRGTLQGACAFGKLTGNFVLESVVKFFGALLLILAGYGVMGAVGAIATSVVLAYFLPPVGTINLETTDANALYIPASFREGMQAIVFFVGQVVINNIDILLVKHFFEPQQAGLYAAVALVGRVVYFACWQVVSAMFPIAAADKKRDQGGAVLAIPLLLVSGIVLASIVALSTFSHAIVTFVFGGRFIEAEPLLSLYAAATGCYALSVVLMTFEMSRKIANTGWLQLIFSGMLIGGISLFHQTLREVVMVQVVLMVVLLLTVSLPFFRMRRRAAQEAA